MVACHCEASSSISTARSPIRPRRSGALGLRSPRSSSVTHRRSSSRRCRSGTRRCSSRTGPRISRAGSTSRPTADGGSRKPSRRGARWTTSSSRPTERRSAGASTGLEPFPEAIATIRCLREHGLRVGLLTNGPSSLQRAKLAVTGLTGEFDAVAISEEIGVAKPDREAFRRAAELIGCALAEVAMVGDSPTYDIAGAVAAGLPGAVLVCNGLELSAADCTIVARLADVPAALGLT
jgi:phosphoglycolate phosphatase-like HAD superfamily hydrolase